MEESDEELVERMSRGEREALGELYERHASEVKRVIWAILKDGTLADDVVQDVFLEAWRKAATFDQGRGTVKGWLVLRARSRSLDRIRSSRRKAETELDGELQAFVVSAEQKADEIHLPAAFSCVTEEEREVLILGYFEGLTNVEIGERLGVPIGTVKSRVRRGVEKMRVFWTEEQS